MPILIVGAGGVGAMAAWRLAKAGHEVTVLEQFDIDHDRGSSYGDSRIVRRVYPDALYTFLMADGYALWDELQEDSGDKELFIQSGGLFLGPSDNNDVRLAQSALEASGVPFETLDATEVMRRFPAFALREEEMALYEPSMGYARASNCVRAALTLAQRYGAKVITGCQIVRMSQTTVGFCLVNRQNHYFSGDRVLLAMGPWTQPFLEHWGVHLPLKVTRQPYMHLHTARNTADFEPDRFPVWIDAAANTYGFPHLGDLPGVKIGLHDFGEATTPETADRAVRQEDREAIYRYAGKRFVGLSREIAYEKVCLYTVAPDNDFIVDALPGLPGAVFISACSGHGFKFTPLLGQVAADMLTGQAARYDLSRFRIDRFIE